MRAVLVSFVLGGFVTSTYTPSLWAYSTFEARVGAGRLEGALQALSAQGHFNWGLGRGVTIQGLYTKGVQGSFSSEAALKVLLADTRLTAVSTSAGTFMITKQPDSPLAPIVTDTPPPPQKSTGEVVVTGSRIVSVDTRRPPNLITIERVDIERSGATSLGELFGRLPGNFGLVNAGTGIAAALNRQAGNNVARGEGVDLLGVGAGATLVLINGQRVAPAGFDGSFVDISLIPLEAIDRVEVLMDAASALYGSDAEAGVVNIILRPDFDGELTRLRYGIAAGGGGDDRGVSQVFGRTWHLGGMMAVYKLDNQQAVDRVLNTPLAPDTPYQLLPSQKCQSGAVTGHHEFSTGTKLSFDAIDTTRDFDQSYSSDPAVPTRGSGDARLVGGGLNLSQKLAGSWHAAVSSAYSKEEENVVTQTATHSQGSQTISTLSSIEARAGGPMFSFQSNPFEIELGAGGRRETFNNKLEHLGSTGSGLRRNVLSAYAETSLPFVSEANPVWWARRLSFNLAVRYDDYDNGDLQAASAVSSNPKISALWSPLEEISLHLTYGRSFRVAPLAQINGSNDSAVLLTLPDPTRGTAYTTLYLSGGNPRLRPELGRSFSGALDWAPPSFPGAVLSLAYFHLSLTDGIAAPTVTGNPTIVGGQIDTLQPFLNTSPTASEIQSIYDRHTVTDLQGLGRTAVTAIFNGQFQNIGSLRESGWELAAKTKLQTGYGQLTGELRGQYLAALDSQADPSASFESLVNTVFNPPRWRLYATGSWTYRRWELTGSANLTGAYKDTLLPAAPAVSSQTILNARLSFSTESTSVPAISNNITLAFIVRNLTNRAPPEVPGSTTLPLGVDLTNAFAQGRMMSVEVLKGW